MISGSNRLSDQVRRIFLHGLVVLSGVLILVGLVSCRSAGHPPGVTPHSLDISDWPQDISDLPSDAEFVFGRLKNGLRYVIRENQTPADRVSLHLYVKVGSLYERDEEQGIAHFLEHMLFNGTKNFPPGEMVKYFQRIGMQFGPDANAHTGFDETVYDVLLPRGDEKSLAEGLLVLRDYADGALLLPEEVEREKRVVLAEMLSRDSATFRTLKAAFDFEMQGVIIQKRFPIGEADIIKKMDADLLRNFYEAWYRPERMFLVVVGDLEKDTAEKLIEKQFADMTSQRLPRPEPAFGQMAHDGVKGFHHFEKDAGSTIVTIETLSSDNQPVDSKQYQAERMVKSLAIFIMQKRLEEMVRGSSTVLASAGIGGDHYLGRIQYAEINGYTNPENWSEALNEIEQALRKAIRHGFTTAELTRAKNVYKAKLIKAKEEEATRESKILARKIMASIRNWRVLQSPRQKAALLLEKLEQVTLGQVNQIFKDMWAADHRLVLLTGNVDLSSDSSAPAKKVESVYYASSKVDVQPMAEKQVGNFPYLPMPPSPGKIERREEIKDLGVTKVVFENGVSLFLKPTRFKENHVLAALSFGTGRSSEPEGSPGLAKMAELVVNESGFGSMDLTALEDVLAGRLASTKLEIREDRFVVRGEANTRELPLLFQLLQAGVLDPGYSEEARQLALKRYEQEYRSLMSTANGVMRIKGFKFLAGGDHRLGSPELNDVRRCTLDQIKAWTGKQLNDSPMELAIVGDFEVEKAIELAALYIGTLPKRNAANLDMPVFGPKFPKGASLSLKIRSETPKALVSVAYPTEDFWDINRTRRLAIMAELYSERLRQHIREKLGAAYSPQAFNRSYRAYKDFGMTQILIQVDPKQADRIVEEVKQISKQLVEKKPDDDEFQRILDPTLTYIKDLRQKNVYWIDSVLTGAARHPERLDWARTFLKDYASIKSDEVSALARRYLIDDAAATIIIKPEAVLPKE